MADNNEAQKDRVVSTTVGPQPLDDDNSKGEAVATSIETSREYNDDTTDPTPETHVKWYDGISRMFLWYPKYLPKDQKKLLLKLDFIILSYICASYFTKSLDKSNLQNAYGTGMREDIKFYDNDLNYAKSLYSAGYIISMCFGTMVVTFPWARLLVPILEVIWGVLTFCASAVNTPPQLFAIRFLIGLAEGPIFPCIVYILGSWYKRDELYRRVMAFSISSTVGGMFSGYLQSAAYSNLSGVGGLEAWRWGFIIDGIVTVPIALFGFFLFPGTPFQVGKTIFWLSDQELSLSKARMEKSGVSEPTAKLSVSLLKKVFSSWRVYFFTVFWILLNVVALPDGLGFNMWLLSKPDVYSKQDYNNYPTIQSAVSIVAQVVLGGLADSYSIYPILTFVQTLFIISYSSLAAWSIPDGYRWFCFMIIGFDSVNQIIISGWINRATRKDAEERAFVLGFSDAVSQAMNIWTNIVFFPVDHSPEFRLGYIVATGAAFIMLLLPLVSHYFERRDSKKREQIYV